MRNAPPSEWKYYTVWVRLRQCDRFLLWQACTETEALWTNAIGQVPSFGSAAELTVLADSLGVRLEPEAPELMDLDPVLTWLAFPARQVPCGACLTAWNLFDDLASGTRAAFIGRRRGPVRNRVYDKLFWGSGTFGVDNDGRMRLRGEEVPINYWKPFWRKEERNTLHRVLSHGFRLWAKYVVPVSNDPA